MTLTRPAYEVTVENLDNPWTGTVEAGETADPDAGVWLADGLTMSWQFAGPPPAQLEPEVVQFAVLADGIANLPRFELGDRVTVDLDRPTAGDPIPYMQFVGRVTDAKIVTDAARDRVMLSITAVDPTAELTQQLSGAGALANVFAIFFVAVTDYNEGGVYLFDPSGPGPVFDARFNNLANYPNGSEAALEAIAKTLAGGLDPDHGLPVMRYVKDSITAADWQEWGPTSGGTPAWHYYMAQWLPAAWGGTKPGLFEYVADPTDADKVTVQRVDTLTLDPDASSIAIVDAHYLPDRAEWTMDRSAAPNQVVINTSAADPVTAGDVEAIARYGAMTRTVETHAAAPELASLAEQYLDFAPSSGAESWIFGTTTLETHLMDDATLDAYAPLFWTPREPSPGFMGRMFVLAGVDPDVDPTPGFMVAHLAGVDFKVQGGRLTITPQLVPAKFTQPAASDSPTYDEFGASAFGAAKYHDAGGTADYIDPELTFDKAKFATL